ncbi:unnamed protein product [Caenorhabditis angaria]|uniref:G-protein coupled receptors family 1 profile domain-containing protein n=1 Tax=Caenorhabditis angaria TaxID=860376 RepID=A0A9P1IZR7_9PELO|nr:unnamed protein product [Caenorhabditis angaria]
MVYNGCGNSSKPFNTIGLQKLAENCVANYTFFDGCNKKCAEDQNFFELSNNKMDPVVYGQIFPVLVLLAVFANAAVAIVLSKKHMVTPTNVVLKYMAIAELLVGLVPLPWTLFFFTMGNYQKQHRLELWWCYLQKYSMDAMPPIFHNIAMWLTVLLAAQRYISISYPLHSRATCSVKNVRYATMIIATTSIICVDGYVYTYNRPTNGYIWKYTKSCTFMHTPLLDLMGPMVFFNIYFWTRALVFIILPSVLLVILNVLLIRGIRKAQKRKLRLLREKRSEEAARQRDSNSTSLMLVAIVSIFLIVNLPQAAFLALLCVCETFNLKLEFFNGPIPSAFLLTSNMIVMATYPINFSIYCFMSSSFRQTFKAMFCPGLKQAEYDRKREVSAVHSGRRSEYCTQLVNISTDAEVSTQISTHRNSEIKYSITNNRLTPFPSDGNNKPLKRFQL